MTNSSNFMEYKIQALTLAEELIEIGLSYKLESNIKGDNFELRVFDKAGKCAGIISTPSEDINISFIEKIKLFINEKKRRFYLVWSPTGNTPPKHRHYSFDDAQREAERLTSLNSPSEFYVLEAKSHYYNNGLPF